MEEKDIELWGQKRSSIINLTVEEKTEENKALPANIASGAKDKVTVTYGQRKLN